MIDVGKLSTLLDDPEVRVVIFGLAHAGPPPLSGNSGASRLRAAVLRVAQSVSPDQYQNWLSAAASNSPITVDQVRAALGDDAINDVAQYARSSPGEVAWQLAAVLPDLVDAISPDGHILHAHELSRELRQAVAAADDSAGPFAPDVY